MASKRNEAERLDPRLQAPHCIEEGELALDEAGMPDALSLPRSRAPNCELCVAEVDGEEQLVLLALRTIAKGEPLSIAVSAADDGDESWEEYEFDPSSGAMARV